MNGASILIVEDDAEIAEFLEVGLSTEGYLVEVTADGRELVAKVAAGGFSV
jgi:DNA-binding response OmpR family regulator